MVQKTCIRLLFIILCLVSPSLFSEEDNQHALTEDSYNVLLSVREAMEQQDYQTAEKKLNELLATDLKPYDQAVAYQTLGYIQISTSKFAGAINSFGRALENGLLPAEVQHQIHYILAQLYIQNANYQEGIRYLKNWLEEEPSPDKNALLLAATTYYQLDNYKDTIKMARRAIELSDKPDPSLYELLISGYFKTRDYKNAVALLKDMVVLFPEKDNYWLQLATSHQLDNNPVKAIAVYEIALAKGILNEKNLLQLIHLYLAENLPYKAASLLGEKMQKNEIENSVENLELLANSWLLAREFTSAITTLEILADISNDPEAYFRLGQINFEQENWQGTVDALELAISNKIDKHIAETQLLLGIAAYHAGKTSKSTQALNEATEYNETRKQALWWLNKIEEEVGKPVTG